MEVGVSTSNAVETVLERALGAVLAGDQALREALDELPAAIYVTDADGMITYFDKACIDFTGRQPEVGADRWCVTWRLYANAGEFLPHDECPMAVAINTKRPVRGVTAVAERPDGTRVICRPYPTPIFDMDGTFAGAVNMLEDVTNEVRAEDFRAQARRCRRLADAVADDIALATLNRMAEEYDGKAAELLAEKRSTISGDVNGHVQRRERVVEAQILLVAALVFGAWWTSFGKLRWLLKPYLNDWQVRACRASTRS